MSDDKRHKRAEKLRREKRLRARAAQRRSDRLADADARLAAVIYDLVADLIRSGKDEVDARLTLAGMLERYPPNSSGAVVAGGRPTGQVITSRAPAVPVVGQTTCPENVRSDTNVLLGGVAIEAIGFDRAAWSQR